MRVRRAFPRRFRPVPLTNRQIERYSRQLIVQGFGAAAQQRLLAAHMLLIAPQAEIDPVLGYLVGAGVGHIELHANHQPTADAAIDATAARMRDLNPDSTVRVGSRVAPASGAFDLALILAGDDASLAQARDLCDRPDSFAGRSAEDSAPVSASVSAFVSASVFARLDQPARIAVIPRRPPCPRCTTGGDLLTPLGAPANNAAFVASLAALEAIKLLAGLDSAPASSLIDFNGYQASARLIVPDSASKCSCNSARLAQRSPKSSSKGPPKGPR
jgi:hypothetical protein